MFSFYSKIYGINIAQLHQGTIWGIGGRFDYDAVYGTVVNRFILQKLLKMPLTIYGEGNQQRSFINIINSIESIELVINTHFKNYQSFNLFTEILSINNIAEKVGEIGNIYPTHGLSLAIVLWKVLTRGFWEWV